MSSKETTIPDFMEIPIDEQDARYSKSFDLSKEADGALAAEFFEKYGFCIFRNVLTEKECEEQIDDMIALLQEKDQNVDPRSPDTWKCTLSHFGSPKGVNGLFRAPLLRLRQHPSLIRAFTSLIGTEDIVVSHDRWLLHRPPPSSTPLTKRNVHLDINPWEYTKEEFLGSIQKRLSSLNYARNNRAWIAENNDVHCSFGTFVQAIVNLRDIPDHRHGGTILVPGSHKTFAAWLRKRADQSKRQVGPVQYFLEPGDQLQSLAQHPTLRAGSVIVWDQRVFHGSTPNMSGDVRAAIPIKAFPADVLRQDASRKRERAAAIERELERVGFGEDLTPLGRKVFGLDLV